MVAEIVFFWSTYALVAVTSKSAHVLQMIKYPCATFCTLTVKQKPCCASSLVVTVGFGGLTETRDPP